MKVSEQKRRFTVDLLRSGHMPSGLDEARLLAFIIGCFICDEHGHFEPDALIAAANDMEMVEAVEDVAARMAFGNGYQN